MSENNRNLVSKVLEELESNAALSEYVKSFSAGDVKASRKIFPFISVGNLSYRIDILTTARDMYSYSLDILAGTHSLVPGLAHQGNDDGKKGIIQLCDDIASALNNNHFKGYFIKPISVKSITHSKAKNNGGTLWLGTVTIEAAAMHMR